MGEEPTLSAKQCSGILHFESCGSVIDYYETAVELAAIVFRRSYETYITAVAPAVQFMAKNIPDQRTALLLAALPSTWIMHTASILNAGRGRLMSSRVE